MADDQSHPSALRILFNRALLTVGSLLAMALFWAAGRQFQIPQQPGYSASILQQPGRVLDIVVIAVTFIAAVLVASVVARRVHRDAGLFCAAIGLAVLSWRGGPMQQVLFEASNRSVFIVLVGETIALAAIVALAWTLLDYLPLTSRQHHSAVDAPDQKYLATLMHVVLMIAFMSLLSRTDAKLQTLASVGISSLLAAIGAQYFSPVNASPWLWAGPFIVAVIGYLSSYFSPAGFETGRVSGYFAALARPLPLDYASAGVAGALLGYWSGLKRRARPDSAHES